MYGYHLVLRSPDGRNRTTLILTSAKKHGSAPAILKESNFYQSFKDWDLLSFAVAYAKDLRNQPAMVDEHVPELDTGYIDLKV